MTHSETAKTMTTAITSTIATKTMNEARDHMSRASGKNICESFLFLFLTLLIFFTGLRAQRPQQPSPLSPLSPP